MATAGLFSGEATENAPADKALTNKQKGYHWMQWGKPVLAFTFTITINDLVFTMPTPEFLWDDVTAAVYDYDVDWGTGEPVEHVTGWNTEHDYTGYDDTFTITITGTMECFRFGLYTPSGDADLMTEFLSWGDVGMLEFLEVFKDCINMQYSALDVPVGGFGDAIEGICDSAGTSAPPSTGDFSVWDVSNVVYFNGAFQGSGYNPDCSSWDVSSGMGFATMFASHVTFNGDLSNWDVSSGVDFRSMFFNCTLFNADLGSWDVSNGDDFRTMFVGTAFNQDISSWTPTKTGDGPFGSLERMLGASNITSNFSQANYDLLLNAWSQLTFNNTGIKFGCGQNYTIATSQAARDILTSAPNNWIIDDSGGI